jgi:allophanate hydrolase
MTAALKVIAPGLHGTIQDLGRTGYRAVGMPPAGPLDRVAFVLANGIVGNPANTPALEILVQGPVLEVVADAVRVALVGGAGAMEIDGERERNVPFGQSARAVRGERLRIKSLGDAACGYLAVEGGFKVPLSLGSAATYTRGRIGGLDGRALQTGDLLAVRVANAEQRPEFALGHGYDLALAQPIRVMLGPQQDYFTEEAVRTLLTAPYTISPQADRMGFRLDGPALDHTKGYNIVSDGIVAGSIQVPGSRRPIVLLADAQTTGGYPKIATVISADVPVIARRKPGSTVRFEAVTQVEAETLRRAQEETLRLAIADLQTVAEGPSLDLGALYAANLIDGAASAFD